MKRILIVDDSPSWRKYHTNAINQLYPDKFEIDTADFAITANEKLYLNEDTPYDIILTDMQMETNFLPLYAGEWLIEQIKKMKNYYKTGIIIISATPTIRMVAQKYNTDYIPKSHCRDINAYRVLENYL